MEEAIFLSKFAESVVVVHRREEWRASKIMLERARERENIELLTPYTVRSLQAGENGALGHAVLVHAETGEERDPGDQRRVHRDRPRAPVRARARAGRRRRERVRPHRGPLHPHEPPRGVRRGRPRRPHLPSGRHRRGHAAARRRWTRSGTSATPPRCRFPRGCRWVIRPKRSGRQRPRPSRAPADPAILKATWRYTSERRSAGARR